MRDYYKEPEEYLITDLNEKPKVGSSIINPSY